MSMREDKRFQRGLVAESISWPNKNHWSSYCKGFNHPKCKGIYYGALRGKGKCDCECPCHKKAKTK